MNLDFGTSRRVTKNLAMMSDSLEHGLLTYLRFKHQVVSLPAVLKFFRYLLF